MNIKYVNHLSYIFYRLEYVSLSYQLFPNVVSAKLGFQNNLNRFSARIEKTKEISQALKNIDDIEVTPFPPHTNILHVYFKRNMEVLYDARDKVAEEEKCWLFTYLYPSEIPN